MKLVPLDRNLQFGRTVRVLSPWVILRTVLLWRQDLVGCGLLTG